ncbi:hypothetical protein OYB12_20875 [Escherichia coli]|uniref:hypothetical protein n=1 Tax=Escherichia coli TaxID=562 RepID=UPI000DA49C31|nr:hypothetical protein [Escherichia coli]EFJ3029517.1 hypothetical protein [Escherichia coli]EGK2856023.1 hypothetical protein [Escherichia coli]EHH6673204.1 hypothetical protein [Escherichia coli]EHI0085613.1 hypothetical protein [Escherichia coli]EHI6968554.1 hypothetical protein [Escherichia coli]
MVPVLGEIMDDKILGYMQRVVRNSRNTAFMDEVRDACLKKQAFCFEAPDGFLVLRPALDDEGTPYVLVLLGVCAGSNSVERYLPEVKTLTRLAGGRWAEFHTARRGFIRLGKRLGFERMPDDEDGFMVFRIEV